VPHERQVSPLAIDLTQMHRRTVTSFYSNLVTRPTGRAVRMGVESQIAELDRERHLCLSILDFSQVRVLDYSCADEIVAKLLLRYAGEDRPTDAYFLARGLQEHHQEAIEAVLERHELLLVADGTGDARLLGPSDPLERTCWNALAANRRGSVEQIAAETSLPSAAVAATLSSLSRRRVAVPLPDGSLYPVHALASL
jgi:hypothetical protein